MAILRKKRIELIEFDPDWNNSYIILGTRGFKELIDYQRDILKIQREDFKLSRELKRIGRNIDLDASLGKESDPALLKQEDELLAKADKIANKMITAVQQFVSQKFVSGVIYDIDLKKDRPMTKEDIAEFDKEVLESIISSAYGDVSKKN